jgi:hypothetical protein
VQRASPCPTWSRHHVEVSIKTEFLLPLLPALVYRSVVARIHFGDIVRRLPGVNFCGPGLSPRRLPDTSILPSRDDFVLSFGADPELIGLVSAISIHITAKFVPVPPKFALPSFFPSFTFEEHARSAHVAAAKCLFPLLSGSQERLFDEGIWWRRLFRRATCWRPAFIHFRQPSTDGQ